MNEQTPVEELKEDSARKGKDPKTRRLLYFFVVLWALTLIAGAVIAWNAYFDEKEKSLTLAQQIDAACEQGGLGVGLSKEEEEVLCENAKKVIEQNDPELQDQEIQESETQDPEIQNPEQDDPDPNDPENQDKEDQDPEIQNPEDQDGDPNDPDPNDDPEINDPDPDDPENQDPEVDDPDPASPYDFVFTFTVPGDGVLIPDRTYIVTCNSGNGQCTVQES